MLKRSINRFALSSILVLAVLSLASAAYAGQTVALNLFSYTLPIIIAFSAFAGIRQDLFRRPSGEPARAFEMANILTAIRIFLVPPVYVLLSRGFIGLAVILYILILITDVADGYVARKYGQETFFGLMLDPFGDIASTLVVFSWLWTSGKAPTWLFAILIFRYCEFFAGILFLYSIGKPPELQATIPGKVAGVIQGTGITMLLMQHLFPALPAGSLFNNVVFTVLAAAFVSVIVSQTYLGLVTIRWKNAATE